MLPFLAHSARSLRAAATGITAAIPASPFHVVLGNESCDADSIVSACCYAYLKASCVSRGLGLHAQLM